MDFQFGNEKSFGVVSMCCRSLAYSVLLLCLTGTYATAEERYTKRQSWLHSRKAVDLAQKFSDRLGLAEIEWRHIRGAGYAEVEFYREKSKRVEDWLSKISDEIQEQVGKKY